MSKNYEIGNNIKSLDELIKQEFIFFNNKLYNKGWFKGWQLNYVASLIAANKIFKAIRKGEDNKILLKENSALKSMLENGIELNNDWLQINILKEPCGEIIEIIKNEKSYYYSNKLLRFVEYDEIQKLNKEIILKWKNLDEKRNGIN